MVIIVAFFFFCILSRHCCFSVCYLFLFACIISDVAVYEWRKKTGQIARKKKQKMRRTTNWKNWTNFLFVWLFGSLLVPFLVLFLFLFFSFFFNLSLWILKRRVVGNVNFRRLETVSFCSPNYKQSEVFRLGLSSMSNFFLATFSIV